MNIEYRILQGNFMYYQEINTLLEKCGTKIGTFAFRDILVEIKLQNSFVSTDIYYFPYSSVSAL